MADKNLTPEQQEKIADILKKYKIEADRIVQNHRQRVTELLEELDRKKIQELEASINKT